MSQDPETKDYILILSDGYCKNFCDKCGKRLETTKKKLCIPCNIKTHSNRESGNNTIDHLIREMQSKVNEPSDVAFEWIPYEDLVIIKELCKDDNTRLYSAKWTKGPLDCDTYDERYDNEKVILKCFIHSQTIFDEFMHEVLYFFINLFNTF